jgi:DNA-binding CsgD family transcriptional regulator
VSKRNRSGGRDGLHVSQRQEQILRLVAAGLSDKEIAAHLKVSPHTVRSHLQRLYRERGFRNRAEAVAAWLAS